MTDGLPAKRIGIGGVVSRTFGAVGANFVTFFLLAILLAAIPAMLLNYGADFLRGQLFSQTDVLSAAATGGVLNLAVAAILMIPSYVLIGAVTQGSIVYYNGGKANFGDCLSTGVRLLLPLVGLGLLTLLGLFLWLLPFAIPVAGLGAAGVSNPLVIFVVGVLLIIPAILAIIRWSTAAPSLVVERIGVLQAFRRSADLTRDNRWAVFFLGLIVIVISVLIQGAISFVALSMVQGFTGSGAGFLLLSIVSILYSALNTMIVTCGQAALYFELRTIKEGATSDELAKVFE